MRKTRDRLTIRRSLGIAVTILFLVLVVYFYAPDVLELYEMRLADQRLLLRGPRTPIAPVRLVLIDDDSRVRYGMDDRMRTELAGVIRLLCDQGARAIGLDIYFSPESSGGDASRAALADAMRACNRVVIGFNWRLDFRDSRLALGESIGRRRLLDATRDPESQAFIAEDLPALAVSPDREILRAAAALGFFSVVTDPDGHPRKIPVAMWHESAYWFPFSLAIVRTYLDSNSLVLRSEGGSWYSGPYLGGQPLHPDPTGYLWLAQYGPLGVFESVNFNDVVARGLPENFAKDAAVLVGVSGRSSDDVFRTLYDPYLPGVALHATAVANALENSFLWRDEFVRAFEVAIMAAIALILALCVPHLPPVTTVILGPALAIGVIVGAHVMLARWSVWIHLIYPLGTLTIIHLGLVAERIRLGERCVREQKEKTAALERARSNPPVPD